MNPIIRKCSRTSLLCSIPGFSHAADIHTAIENIESNAGQTQEAHGNWVDNSHQYIGTKADDLAIYLDRFFGAPLEDLESADSTVRFVTRFDWDDDDGSDSGFSLRGTVHLPRISERLSLVFEGDDGDAEEEFDINRSESNEVGLQLNTADGKNSRFDLTVKLSSGPNLKPGVRYRFKDSPGDWGGVFSTWLGWITVIAGRLGIDTQ